MERERLLGRAFQLHDKLRSFGDFIVLQEPLGSHEISQCGSEPWFKLV